MGDQATEIDRAERCVDPQLIPSYEADLVPLAIGTANTALTFATSAKFEQAPPAKPLILQVQCDAIFYEGQGVPDPTVNIPRAANVLHSIPVRGRLAWNFKAGDTATIKGKLLGAL